MYSSPDLGSAVLLRIKYGTEIQTEESPGKWKKIYFDGKEGYTDAKLNTSAPGRIFYVDNLEGLEVYETLGPEPKQIGVVPHKGKVTILDTVFQDKDGKFNRVEWAFVETEKSKGYVRLASLTAAPRTYYFAVMAKQGIWLRSKPEFRGQSLILLPFGTIGEILEKTGELLSAYNSRGYWFRTEYKGKTGWIFSGFTVTSTEKSYLEDRDYIRNEEWFLRYLEKPNNVEPFPFDESILEGAKVEKIEKTYYTVYNIQYGKPLDDCSVENNSRVVFVNKKTRQAYSIQGLYKEDLVSHGNPFPDSIYTSYDVCNCCCPNRGNLLYFLFEDKVLSVPHRDKDSKGLCNYGNVESVELGRETRYDKENKAIYLYLRLPFCSPPPEGETLAEPIDYTHSLFTVIRQEKDNVNIERYFDNGIPEKYRDQWDKLHGGQSIK
ncbi:MAG TPA: SH3 domain-containing protein [Leptospiraceae bacterium]|nr:SH3 domain-containing protein [Leptospiraceae bacterium]